SSATSSVFEPRKLVKYVGLNPAFDNSREAEWSGGIGGHGRRDLRSLLIESAQAILRSEHPLAKWGKKLLAKKGSINHISFRENGGERLPLSTMVALTRHSSFSDFAR